MNREPLHPKFEYTLRLEIEKTLIKNYEEDNKTTKFDFKTIKMYFLFIILTF